MLTHFGICLLVSSIKHSTAEMCCDITQLCKLFQEMIVLLNICLKRLRVSYSSPPLWDCIIAAFGLFPIPYHEMEEVIFPFFHAVSLCIP